MPEIMVRFDDLRKYCEKRRCEAVPLEYIKQMITVEAEPVRYGRWIDKGDYAVCTECGGHSGTQYDGVEPIPLMSHFCQHCGAVMKKSGQWIPIEYDSYADGAPVWDKYECSECGHEHNGEEDTLTVFCPDCGSRLKE